MELSDLKKPTPSQEDVLDILKNIVKKSKSNEVQKAVNSLIDMINNKNIVPNKKTIDNAINQLQQAYPEKIDNIFRLNDSINNLLTVRMEKIGSQFDDIIKSFQNEEKKQNSDPVLPVTNNNTNAATDSMEIELDNLIQDLGKKPSPANATNLGPPPPDFPPPPPPPNAASNDSTARSANAETTARVDAAPDDNKADAAPNNTVDAAPNNTVDAAPNDAVDAAPNNAVDATPNDIKIDAAPNASDLSPPPNVPSPPPNAASNDSTALLPDDAKAGAAADNASVETRTRANAVIGKDAKTDAQAAMSEVRNEQRKGWDNLISEQRKKNMKAAEAKASNAAVANDAKTQVDETKQPVTPTTVSSRARAASDAAPNAAVATSESRPRAASFSGDEKKEAEQKSAPGFIEALRITITERWKSAKASFSEKNATPSKNTTDAAANPDVKINKQNRSISYMIPENLSAAKLKAAAESIAADVAAKAQSVKGALLTITGGLPSVIDIVQKAVSNIQRLQSTGPQDNEPKKINGPGPNRG